MPRKSATKRGFADIFDNLEDAVAPVPSVLQSLGADSAPSTLDVESPVLDESIFGDPFASAISAALRTNKNELGSSPSAVRDGTSPPTKPKRKESMAFANQSQSQAQDSQGGETPRVFLSELGLHQKRAEEQADAVLFCAEALSKAANPRSLIELLECLTANKTVLNTVRKLGHAKSFVENCAAKPQWFSQSSRAAHAALIRHLANSMPKEVLSCKSLFTTVLALLRNDPPPQTSPPQVTSPIAKSNEAPKVLHWSMRVAPKKEASKPIVDASTSMTTLWDDEVCECASALCKIDGSALKENATVVGLCIEILTHLLLTHNQQEELLHRSLSNDGLDGGVPNLSRLDSNNGPSSTPTAVLMLQAGGFESLHKMLTTCEDEELFRQTVQLLDVATCCTQLKQQNSDTTLKLFSELLGFLVKKAHDIAEKASTDATPSASHGDDECLMLRVGMNITTLWPQCAPADPIPCKEFATNIKRTMLLHEATSDVVVCGACLLINVLKTGENTALQWTLLDDSDWVRHIAEWVVSLRTGDDAAENVAAGYLAMVLGILSLGTEESRIVIVTALTKAYKDERIAHKPMVMIVAILQEFVMFQSTAGILTKEALLSLHKITERLIEQNGIEVAAADDNVDE